MFPRHGVLWQTYIYNYIIYIGLIYPMICPSNPSKPHQIQLNPINNFAESIMGLMRISRQYHGEYIANASFPSIFGGFPINQSLNGRMLSRVPTVYHQPVTEVWGTTWSAALAIFKEWWADVSRAASTAPRSPREMKLRQQWWNCYPRGSWHGQKGYV